MGYVEALRARVGVQPLVLAGACVVILDDSGRVLLGRRSDSGQWDLIGGYLEPGETFEAAARREAREEAGLALGALRVFDLFSGAAFFHRYPNGDQVYGVGVAFVAEWVSGAPTLDGFEVAELRFFPLDALPVPLDPSAEELLERYVRASLDSVGPVPSPRP
jgi:8-oxo-dGTP pyrophosphatase MutT (NUDIX family)